MNMHSVAELSCFRFFFLVF